ncbi:MAG: LysM peptidoglycan-binding domain-containing protein [Bdellovibrionaceae bacterium]|nr:LysM peptidoglycan-binding domain-containing protein [Pseudobdellovibrionaceae bacterium]
MQKIVSLTLVVALVSACAHSPRTADSATPSTTTASTTTTANAPDPSAVKAGEEDAPPLKDLESFRVKDAEGPKVVDQELEAIPTEVNPLVEQWVGYFQGRGRRHMERYLARSTRYEKLMKKVLKDNGLPEDLFYIALIESGFNTQARSHAAAVGYWQFIRGTGKRYGLEISALVDERKDPVLATQAAAEYFKGLYSVFGSWYLAMASYNVGENRVKREVMNHYTRDFWELAKKKRFPKETIHYIPKFIAAKLIAKDPEKYGFAELDYMAPIEFDHITVDTAINLRVMAEKMGINYEEFKDLNPKFKGEVAPLKANNKLELRIPPGTSEAATVAANQSVVEKVEYIADAGDTEVYRIKRGDSLHTVARKYRTTVAYLRDLNDIPKGKRLKVGMKLYVPDRAPVAAKRKVVSKAAAKKSKNAVNASSSDENAPAVGSKVAMAGGRFYTVQSGDTLSSIAKKYAVSISQLKRANNIRRGRLLKVGVRLEIPGDSKAPSSDDGAKRLPASSAKRAGANKAKYHVVKRGENLSNIAGKYKISVSDIKSKNKLNNISKLFVGARLLIPEALASK